MSGKSVLQILKEHCPTISVGVLTADLMRMEAELEQLNGTGVQILHFDVMDGCFVPMMTVGPPYIKGVRTELLKDVHLMIQDPVEKIDAFVAAGADILTVHVESCTHIHRVFQQLALLTNANDPARGIVRGVALNPGTPVAVIEPLLGELEMVTLVAINPGWGGQSFISDTFRRIEQVREMAARAECEVLVGVDGGVTKSNVAEIAGSGADVVVTGSAVFDGRDVSANARYMLEHFSGA